MIRKKKMYSPEVKYNYIGNVEEKSVNYIIE